MNVEQQQANAPPEIRNIAKFLRSSGAGIKIRVGVLNGKRLDYFKGKAAIKAILSPAYAKLKNVPPQPANEAEATLLLTKVLPSAFFLLVDRGGPSGGSNSPKHLQINPMQTFKSDGYFAWFYEGSQLLTYLGGAGLVAVMLAGVMFPLWPPIMRLGVWYLSMLVLAFLAALFALAIVRLILYIITVFTAPPGLWIFPNLFADVGFIESFIPLYEWDYPKKKSKKKSKEKGAEGESEKKSKKSKGDESNGNGTAQTTATASSNAQPRGAYIEEVDDE